MLIYKKKIKNLIDRFFTSRGALIKKIEPDLWEVTMPGDPSQREELDEIFEGKKHLLFTFSSEYHRLNPDSTLITVGSPVLNRIREILGSGVRWSEGYLAFNPEEIYSLQKNPPPGFTIKADRVENPATGIEYTALARYVFVFTISGEDLREEILPIYSALADNKKPMDFPVLLKDFEVTEDPPLSGIVVEHTSLKDAYFRAEFWAYHKARPLIEKMKSEAVKAKKKEMKRLNAYFKDLKASARKKSEGEEIEESFRRRKEELEQRFDIVIDARLESALKIYAPRIRYRRQVEKSGKRFFVENVYDYVPGEYLPFECPVCKKEALTVAVCKIHGPVCEDEVWRCPVCGEDRCNKCESIDCSIDGEKKDMECTFNCVFCQSRVGLDHKIKCSKCGKEGCIECILKCGDCGGMVCPDCGWMCGVCKKTFCRDRLDKCDKCPALVCSGCEIRTCSDCGVKACHQHSYKCPSCGNFFCKEHSGGQDAVSGGLICSGCAYKCPSCGTVVPKDRAGKCAIGGEDICPSCERVCIRCEKSFCKTHADKCSSCGGMVCVEDSTGCPSCGDVVCSMHTGECPSCGLDYCEKCLAGADVTGVCALCSALEPLKKGKAKTILDGVGTEEADLKKIKEWEYAKGERAYVYKGRTFLNEVTVCVDANSQKVMNVKKTGIINRITGLFGG